MTSGIPLRFERINKVLLLGGGELFLSTARYLKDSGFKLTVVTSQRHADEAIHGEPLGKTLTKHGIPFLISTEINRDPKVRRHITKQTIGISIGSAWIFKEPFISLFKGRLINSHGTRLPQDRGGGGFTWRILRKNYLGFAILHQVDGGIDTGNILYKEFFYPRSCRTPADFEAVSFKETLNFIKALLEKFKKGEVVTCYSQQEYFSMYWPRLVTEVHGYLDWSWKLSDLESFICAFDQPYRGASTFINGQKVFVRNCFVDIHDGGFHPFQKGLVFRKSDGALWVATEDGTLVIQEVRDESNKNQYEKINLGDRFFTPAQYLEEAKTHRAIYTPTGVKKR